MKLHELKPNVGKTKPHRRVGRGTGSGRGKTSGRGTKGQGARAGGGTGLYHQGGNLPFFRRLPFKRGFNPPFRGVNNEINLDQLAKFKANSEVNAETLLKAGLLRYPESPIVLLARGDLSTALKVRVHRASKGAVAKVEKAGGSVELIQAKQPKQEPKKTKKAKSATLAKQAKPAKQGEA